MANELKPSKKDPIAAQSFKKNLSYQTIYQIIILVIPLFTAPFLTRTLGDTALGSLSYVDSYVSYFSVLAALGISNYGVRAISSVKNDYDNLRRTFWSLYLTHIFTSFLSIGLYLILACLSTENHLLFLVETLSLSSTLFDITWLFTGLENFKGVVLRSLAAKIISTVLIFALIRTQNDIYLYAWILGGTGVASQIILIPWAIRHIKPIRVTFRDCASHIKPLLILFVGAVAITLYTTLDRTLLGLQATKEDVAYYTYADKIITIPKTIMNVIISVSLPRVCALLSEGKLSETKKYVNYSLQFISLLGMGTLFGLLALGNEMAIVYYGDGFTKCGEMLLWMSPLPYIVVVGNIGTSEYLIPMKKDKSYTIVFWISSIFNVILSAILIPAIGAIGAIVGTLVAESIRTILDLFLARNIVSFKEILKAIIPYAIIGGLMYGLLFLIQYFWGQSVIQLITLIFIGLLFYLILSSLYLLFISKDKNNYRLLLAKAFKKK